MASTAVDVLYNDFVQLSILIAEQGELSLGVSLDDNFRKSLVLAAASYFEYQITNHVLAFSEDASGKSPLLPSFVKNKAISRQYHTWFSWERNNANTFFSLFGPEFQAHMDALIKKEEKISGFIKDFMSIGLTRNRLAHQNYATFTLEKTAREIYDQYQSALNFVELIPHALRSCSQNFSGKKSYKTIRCQRRVFIVRSKNASNYRK